MKGTWNKLRRGEKGQALIIVLILMALGGLIIAPLLGFMSAGLVAGQVFEVKMEGLYAADAGIEDTLWKLLNGYYLPPHYLTDVNGMDVTVEQIGYEETADGKLYTIQSTAELAGETKAEIIAQVLVAGGSVAEGGEGGEYKTNEDMQALSLIDEYTIIFTTQNNSEFWGREDDQSQPGTEIEPCDLASLNMATGIGALYLDGDDVMANPNYKINGVHYYHDEVDGYDYLLMTINTTADVGTPPVEFNNTDIFKLHVDSTDPEQWKAELVYIIDADVVALSAQGLGDEEPANDIILFSISDQNATLGGTEFHRGDIIKYDPNTGGYNLKVDVNAILSPLGNPNLELDCLAVLSESDPRLLLSFGVDPVTGTDYGPIKSQDIAIWDPGEDGIPNTEDDSITLHISMSEETTIIGSEMTVSIVSWEIS